jgi:MFS family permease
MTSSANQTTKTILWLQVILAAAAMVMTIPGRTQGLGLITEPVIADSSLHLDHTLYAWLNLMATLGGALFALPFGWLIDHLGIRFVLIVNLLLLAIATSSMAAAGGVTSFFIGMLLTRGLGQSALSTTSLTLVGKWFTERLTYAMAIFSVVSGIGFIVLFMTVGYLVKDFGWRWTWQSLGVSIGLLGVVAWIYSRNPSSAAPSETKEAESNASAAIPSATLKAALRSPIFWVFGLSSSLFLWVSSGIGLFNEDVLAELHFDKDTYIAGLGISTFATLITNGLAGWLSMRWSLPRLMMIGMLLLAVCLGFLPFMTEKWHVYLNAIFLGTSAGIVMVVFFACWGYYFGREHLGLIQGSAQALTVLASALGPVSMALCKQSLGSYRPLFFVLAGLAILSAGSLILSKSEKMKQS